MPGTRLNNDDTATRVVLTTSRNIAVVGHSDDEYITSYDVGMYLRRAGYRVFAVNPNITDVDGEPAYASLDDVPEPIDIVDVFRAPAHVPHIVEDAIRLGAKTLWLQEEVFHDEAEQRALDAGLNVASNVCIRTEHRRLLGE